MATVRINTNRDAQSKSTVRITLRKINREDHFEE
ncbi:unnamed protein product [Arabidopsis halleri]